jgi:hypothetical protein
MSVVRIERPPQTDEELWWYIKVLWGIEIPRSRVCPGHRAPFEALADAYFARFPVIVCKASRGFGGKTTLLGTLTLTEMVALGAQVTVLGGSGVQSKRILAESQERWGSQGAPRGLLMTEPGAQTTRLRNGASATALMASQRSVRGPHPQRLRMDECDEMELKILDAALGQPMAEKGIPAQILLSSTHHNPAGTFTEILKRVKEKGWPLYEWCYRETMAPHGWIAASEVERARASMPSGMWQTEVEGQEPTAEGRAFLTELVDAYCDPDLGEREGGDGEYCEFEPPEPLAIYATGADWAKEQHWTVITTYRADIEPWRLVAFERMQRLAWPYMVSRLGVRAKRFPGLAAHDATGGGNVVADLLRQEEIMAEDVIMVGRGRQDLFTEYVAAVENRKLRAPRIAFMHGEHRYCANKDLYGAGHPPDSVVAGALAWGLRNRIPRGYAPAGVGARTAHQGPHG